MLTLNNVSFEFGGRFLYRNASWDVQPGDKVGLIGRNGTGKSTLLRLMVGEYRPTEGNITKANNLKIGFLNQDLLGFESADSIFAVAQAAFGAQLKLEQEINGLLHQMETHYTDELIHDLGDKQAEFERLGGYEMEAKTRAMLAGLGFEQEDQDRPYDTFSGGWRMRAILAKMLLEDPDVLLLDEPTNHLDLPSILWLENYLSRSRAAYVIVSHDRYFLNRMVTQVVEVAHSKLHFYAGDYNFYLREKELRKTLQQSAYDNQQKSIAESERFIERFRAKASKASQAQSRIKSLEKLERIDAPEGDEAQVSFSFQPGVRPGVDILSMKNIFKAYDNKTILSGANAEIQRGDKIGLIGANGVGKSTVLRIVADADTYSGSRTLGYNVQPAFFAQHQLEALGMDNTILEEVGQFAYERGETYVRSILGSFLFTGDDVQKKIKVLSGGERSRIALAKTLLSQANFMLLDEPTNHLDMQSIQILAQALQQYQGTFILVSHDRFFLSLAVNKIWYIEDRQIKEYPGNYAEYEAWQATRVTAPDVKKTAKAMPEATATKVISLSEADKKQQKQRQNQVRQAESTIAELETKLGVLEAELARPEIAADFKKVQVVEQERKTLRKELDAQLAQWEALLTELEAVG